VSRFTEQRNAGITMTGKWEGKGTTVAGGVGVERCGVGGVFVLL
jgi:hypothetical protein